MDRPARCRILAVMGSGETSPTMVNVHRMLVARLGAGPVRAVLLETPYAFQENAAGVSARAQAYFARSVGLAVTVIAGTGTTGGGTRLTTGPRGAAVPRTGCSPARAARPMRSPGGGTARSARRCGTG